MPFAKNSTNPPSVPPIEARPDQARARHWLAMLGVFVMALVPRVLPGRFLTIDESYHWIGRVAAFEQALANGQYAGTNLIGHPGVTTLWLGTFGSWLEQWLGTLGIVASGDPDLHRTMLRIPVGAVSALCVGLAYPFLRRLVAPRIAIGALLLWAGEPFLVAHAQLLHLDSLLASFMMLSLLALMVAAAPASESGPVRIVPLLLSAIAGGLALLTKSPSIALLPVVGLLLVWRQSRQPVALRLVRAGIYMAVWLAIAALVWVALWPAAWGDPGGAVRRVVFQAQADGGSPHGWGNFFMGRPTDDPGPLFYPVAVALRLAPWTLIGLVACVLAGQATVRRLRTRTAMIAWLERHYVAAWLSLFVLLFIAMMSVPPKKFDRYALPIFPALDVLAAIGFGHVLARFRLPNAAFWRVAGWAAAGGVLAANLACYHPYELAYYNPLVGGSAVAVRTIPVGWGEGYELAGDYIRTQPNGADRPVAALYEPVLTPYVPQGAAPMDWAFEPGRVDYAVLYIDQIQRQYKPYLITPLQQGQSPVYTVRMHGIDYAYVYQIAPPAGTPIEADFGDAVRLRGYSIDRSALQASGLLTVTLQWQGRATPARDYNIFVHVFDAAGQKVGQVDVPIGDPRWPSHAWSAGRYIPQIQRVPLPARLPPGSYTITLGVYDPQSFARLPLASSAPHSTLDGADALQLPAMQFP